MRGHISFNTLWSFISVLLAVLLVTAVDGSEETLCRTEGRMIDSCQLNGKNLELCQFVWRLITVNYEWVWQKVNVDKKGVIRIGDKIVGGGIEPAGSSDMHFNVIGIARLCEDRNCNKELL